MGAPAADFGNPNERKISNANSCGFTVTGGPKCPNFNINDFILFHTAARWLSPFVLAIMASGVLLDGRTAQKESVESRVLAFAFRRQSPHSQRYITVISGGGGFRKLMTFVERLVKIGFRILH